MVKDLYEVTNSVIIGKWDNESVQFFFAGVQSNQIGTCQLHVLGMPMPDLSYKIRIENGQQYLDLINPINDKTKEFVINKLGNGELILESEDGWKPTLVKR